MSFPPQYGQGQFSEMSNAYSSNSGSASEPQQQQQQLSPLQNTNFSLQATEWEQQQLEAMHSPHDLHHHLTQGSALQSPAISVHTGTSAHNTPMHTPVTPTAAFHHTQFEMGTIAEVPEEFEQSHHVGSTQSRVIQTRSRSQQPQLQQQALHQQIYQQEQHYEPIANEEFDSQVLQQYQHSELMQQFEQQFQPQYQHTPQQQVQHYSPQQYTQQQLPQQQQQQQFHRQYQANLPSFMGASIPMAPPRPSPMPMPPPSRPASAATFPSPTTLTGPLSNPDPSSMVVAAAATTGAKPSRAGVSRPSRPSTRGSSTTTTAALVGAGGSRSAGTAGRARRGSTAAAPAAADSGTAPRPQARGSSHPYAASTATRARVLQAPLSMVEEEPSVVGVTTRSGLTRTSSITSTGRSKRSVAAIEREQRKKRAQSVRFSEEPGALPEASTSASATSGPMAVEVPESVPPSQVSPGQQSLPALSVGYPQTIQLVSSDDPPPEEEEEDVTSPAPATSLAGRRKPIYPPSYLKGPAPRAQQQAQARVIRRPPSSRAPAPAPASQVSLGQTASQPQPQSQPQTQAPSRVSPPPQANQEFGYHPYRHQLPPPLSTHEERANQHHHHHHHNNNNPPPKILAKVLPIQHDWHFVAETHTLHLYLDMPGVHRDDVEVTLSTCWWNRVKYLCVRGQRWPWGVGGGGREGREWMRTIRAEVDVARTRVVGGVGGRVEEEEVGGEEEEGVTDVGGSQIEDKIEGELDEGVMHRPTSPQAGSSTVVAASGEDETMEVEMDVEGTSAKANTKGKKKTTGKTANVPKQQQQQQLSAKAKGKRREELMQEEEEESPEMIHASVSSSSVPPPAAAAAAANTAESIGVATAADTTAPTGTATTGSVRVAGAFRQIPEPRDPHDFFTTGARQRRYGILEHKVEVPLDTTVSDISLEFVDGVLSVHVDCGPPLEVSENVVVPLLGGAANGGRGGAGRGGGAAAASSRAQ